MKQLELRKSLDLLKKYKINFVDHKIIKNEKDLGNIRYPVVMKVFSEKIIHKSEEGGVIIGIKNREDAIKSFEKLKKISKDILIQKLVVGKEVIVGMKKDAQFGPVIMFGLGGIFVEVIKDVSLRICPVSKADALSMIKEIKSYKILEGIRGEKKVNINALADTISKISNLAMKEKIAEIDLNPIIVGENEAVVVDVRFMI